MFRPRTATIILGIAVLCAFLLGPLLHNAIPHSHGADHHGAPSVMWGDMHSSLRHEDKQLLATVELILATFIALLAFVAVSSQRISLSATVPAVRARQESLHTGREQYRRFG
jgi:hypothetical protein